jgi:hypothetical protein
LLKLQDLIRTKTGKQLAAPRHQLLVTYMQALASEFKTIGEPLPAELRTYSQK